MRRMAGDFPARDSAFGKAHSPRDRRVIRSFYREPRSSAEVLDELQLTEKADAWVGKLSGASEAETGSWPPRWSAIRKYCFWMSANDWP